MLEIKHIERVGRSEWQNLLEYSPTASYFQSPECYDFFCSLSFLDTFGWGVFENGQLKAVVTGYIIANGGKIKQFFSRRAIIHGGVLLADDVSDNALARLLNELKKSLSEKAIYIEIRNNNDFNKYKSVFEKNGFGYNEHLNFHIQTPDVNTAFSQLNSTKRRDVRLSIKNGAKLIDKPNIAQIRHFYKILSNLYATKIKLPLFPFEFFEKLYRTSFGKFFLISYRGKIIGGSVCVELSSSVLYEMFLCGLDKKFNNIYTSTLSTWFAIKYASCSDIRYLDMMGAGKPSDDYGVRDFKEKFGGKLVEHGRFLFISNSFLYRLGCFGIKLLQHL